MPDEWKSKLPYSMSTFDVPKRGDTSTPVPLIWRNDDGVGIIKRSVAASYMPRHVLPPAISGGLRMIERQRFVAGFHAPICSMSCVTMSAPNRERTSAVRTSVLVVI